LAITGASAGAKRKICRTRVRWLGYCVLWVCYFAVPWAHALGLGDLRLHSNLGQPLRASVLILGEQTEPLLQVCVKARLVNLEGALIAHLRVSVGYEAGLPALLLTSHANIEEPVLTIQLEMVCESQINRNYQVLLDPSESPAAAIAQTAVSTPSTVPPASTSATSKSSARSASLAARADTGPGLTRRLSRESQRRARNVLKLEAGDSSDSLLLGPHANPAPPTTNEGRLPLQLSRRLRNDTSSVGSAAQEVFSETVRQQQNQAVFLALGRAELNLMKQQILAMEAELVQLKQAAPPAAAPPSVDHPSAGRSDPVSALASPDSPDSPDLPEVPAAEPAVINAPILKQVDNRIGQWLLGLAVLLLICLSAIVWLLWRLLQLRSAQAFGSAPQSVAGPIGPASRFAPGTVGDEPKIDAKVSPPAKARNPARTGKRAPEAVAKPHAPPVFTPGFGPGVAPSLEPLVPVVAPDTNEMNFDFGLVGQTRAEPSLPGPSGKQSKSDKLEADDGTPLHSPLHSRNSMDYITPSEMPKVEELNDVMYEAEFWISLNKIGNAIRLLEQYTISDQGSSPLPWLLLFDLYRKTGQIEQYMSLQRQFQRFFNGKIPDWEDYDRAQSSIGLDTMGSLMARIEVLWHTDEIIPFIESLLLDDRDGTREGFELGVYRDILFLCDLAKEMRRSNSGQ
jgi:pilus assembly protein FimV